MTSSSLARLRIRVRGLVQGVGFRPFVYQAATAHGFTGWVRNDEQGVLLEVQGEGVERLAVLLRGQRPPLARVDAVEVVETPVLPADEGFVIEASLREGTAAVAIGPDAGVCEACAEEVCTPGARRYRYPFTTCTHCGPRYSITRRLPYDRQQTSMSGFSPCDDCQREYADPTDRRFHAQPLACPRCGPTLSMPLERVAEHLKAGAIVALKGLGGFQLVCDARNPDAVATLRARKHRDLKPFAVMVASLEGARPLVELSEAEARLLTGWQRPIVLANQRGPRLPDLIAPSLRTLGVMLPTTPLHLLLFHELAGRPPGTAWLRDPGGACLVVTSANPAGEPLVIDDAEAASRLTGIADVVVTHDRAVVVRVDDSVTRVVAGAATVLRRARGFVPLPIKLPRPVAPVLALGAHLKATVCFTRGDEAFVSQHVGDLDTVAGFRFLEETVAHLRRTLEVTPALVAQDLHPDFLSTRLAAQLGLPTLAVQHHHAHLAAVLAEHQRTQPTVGLALDGFGLGADSGSWGGELLRLDGARFTRLGHLTELRQPGGDRAAKEPWRMAASALHRLGRGREIEARFKDFPHAAALAALLDAGVSAPWTSSCGRLFDAACGLLGVLPTASYEGAAPMALEGLVTRPEVLAGAWRVRDGQLDLRPLLDALIGREPVDGANVFHGTLAAALVDWATPQLEGGVVALGGGCLMNRVLAEALVAGFEARGATALLPRQVPANDGGLSLGQAWVAARSMEE